MVVAVRIEVAAGVDGPLVRKIAETDLGRARLRLEADRLERSRHPGVVAVVDATDEVLVLAWAGTDTLATTRPPLSVAAGILAAVATTVADLHELGIVHGRLEPDHVVLAGDGRPRLCGLRGVDAGQVPATPADDVAALGRLIDHLVGADAEPEPIPERRWIRPRWTGWGRRALLTLADQASDPDPARRPTARALAAAIADTVPEAHLAAPVAEGAPAAASPPPDPPEPTDELPEAQPAVRWTVDHDLPAPPQEESEPAAGPIAPTTATDAGGDEGEPRFLGLRIEPGTEPAGPEVTTRRPPRRSGRRSGRLPVAVAIGGLLLVAALGWARPGPDPGRAEPPVRAAAPATATAAPTAATALTALTAPAPTDPLPAPSTRPACPTSDDGLGADVDGDGCAEPVAVQGNRITVDGSTFEVGEAGDAVAVGDWDCDGLATPGLVRPASGEVFLFDRWTAGTSVVTVPATSVVPGARALEPPAPPGSTGCPGPAVRLADGSTRPLSAEVAP